MKTRAKLALTSVAAALAVAVCGSPAPAAAAYYTNCGTEEANVFITTKAHAVSCEIARRVGRQYALNGDRHPLGFDCSKPHDLGSGEAFRARCIREGETIKINYGL